MHELAGCRVTTKFGTVNGYVTEHVDGVLRMQLDVPPAGRKVGDEATVTVLDPVRGECVYAGLLARLAGPSVDVVVVERGQWHQRRSASRAPYRISCLGTLDPDGTAEPIPLTVLDVSASGLRLGTKRALASGAVVELRLPVDGVAIGLRARVLRIEESMTGWRYGCELLDLADRTRETLFRLVLRLQREEARRAAAARD